jgi:hypothetical protein
MLFHHVKTLNRFDEVRLNFAGKSVASEINYIYVINIASRECFPRRNEHASAKKNFWYRLRRHCAYVIVSYVSNGVFKF